MGLKILFLQRLMWLHYQITGFRMIELLSDSYCSITGVETLEQIDKCINKER